MKVTTAADFATVNLELTVEEHGQFIMILGYAAGSVRPEDTDIKRMIYSFLESFAGAAKDAGRAL